MSSQMLASLELFMPAPRAGADEKLLWLSSTSRNLLTNPLGLPSRTGASTGVGRSWSADIARRLGKGDQRLGRSEGGKSHKRGRRPRVRLRRRIRRRDDGVVVFLLLDLHRKIGFRGVRNDRFLGFNFRFDGFGKVALGPDEAKLNLEP